MEALLNTIIKAFGWSIFHSLWQGAIIYGILFLVLTTWSRLSAKLKHNMAFGAICLMFCSFLLTFGSILKLPSAGLNMNLSQHVPVNLDSGITAQPLSFASLAERCFPYLVGLYTLGLMLQVAVILYGYQKLEGIKHALHHKVPEHWHKRFREVLAQLQINKPVGFYLSDKVNVPLVIGFFKPVILFPVTLATQLDIHQVEAILIHELSHIRRNDFLLNLVKTGIETILFFNPFVWLSSRFIHIEREHDCDDLVVKFTGTPLTYAHALLKIELIKDKHTPALSLAASGSSQHLYQRIKRITDMKTTYINAKQRIFAITLTLGTIISLAWISPAQEKEAVKTAADVLVQNMHVYAQHSFRNPLKVSGSDQATLSLDSPEKKKKVKVVIVDEKGRKRTFNSVSELPDSLMGKFGNHNFQFDAMELPVIDSATLIALRRNAEAFTKRFNSPEEKAKWDKFGKEMQKRGQAFEKKFNSPEEQAKWKELTDSLSRLSVTINKRLNSPEFTAQMKKLNERLSLKSKEMQMMMLMPDVPNVPGIPNAPGAADAPSAPEPIKMQLNRKYELKSSESEALKNSEEYRKLQQDFEAKVEKLKKKQEKNK